MALNAVTSTSYSTSLIIDYDACRWDGTEQARLQHDLIGITQSQLGDRGITVVSVMCVSPRYSLRARSSLELLLAERGGAPKSYTR